MVLTYNVLNVSSTVTVATNIDAIIINNPGNTIIINLPKITALGQRFLIKRIDNDSNQVLLIPNGSDTIYNVSTQTVGNGQCIEIVSNIIDDVANWEFVNNVFI
jgi:hypothetical protein